MQNYDGKRRLASPPPQQKPSQSAIIHPPPVMSSSPMFTNVNAHPPPSTYRISSAFSIPSTSHNPHHAMPKPGPLEPHHEDRFGRGYSPQEDYHQYQVRSPAPVQYQHAVPTIREERPGHDTTSAGGGAAGGFGSRGAGGLVPDPAVSATIFDKICRLEKLCEAILENQFRQNSRLEALELALLSSPRAPAHARQFSAFEQRTSTTHPLAGYEAFTPQQVERPGGSGVNMTPHSGSTIQSPTPRGMGHEKSLSGTMLPPLRSIVRGVKSPTPRSDSTQGLHSDSVKIKRQKPVPVSKPDLTDPALQRKYKLALLRLLSLDSFYPTDHCMLGVFRKEDDFSPEAIEIHSSHLLSWSRSWLRYTRNAVLRGTFDNSISKSREQLAKQLQQDMNSTEEFTTPENIRRVALLRLLYFQWQSENRLGTKSSSMYRDYESRLNEIKALPSSEQEVRWNTILGEEDKWWKIFQQSASQATSAGGNSSGATGTKKD
ncbi:hypothetical protein H4219_000761 [Mycoemilia scoparia]|uniref:Uncharacterized protein n=1 Tax=Mycoemilia scoparia TaxID=417184 RepID=A0A9W8A646_9FUNG|nr:hypothetical protein H4219_000761 [Mycoemilia scoparia]